MIATLGWSGSKGPPLVSPLGMTDNWPGHHDNVYVAAGFFGHGFMHALGVGRGLTEHLADRRLPNR